MLLLTKEDIAKFDGGGLAYFASKAELNRCVRYYNLDKRRFRGSTKIYSRDIAQKKPTLLVHILDMGSVAGLNALEAGGPGLFTYTYC